MTAPVEEVATRMARGNCHVLLVDDDADVLRGCARALGAAGFAVETAQSGAEAIERLRRGPPLDVIVSDITMPEMDGLTLLRGIREHDLDVPVVLVTGVPSVETAIQAVEHGAFRYLTKPVGPEQLADVARRAACMHEFARAKREALAVVGVEGKTLGDRAALEARFDKALARLWIAFEPIVRWSERQLFAYEAQARSDEPSLGGPADLFDVATRLKRLPDLGQAVRARVAESAREAPPDALLFVSVHPAELNDPELFSLVSPLGEIAERVVLEITERSALDEVQGLGSRSAKLRRMGYRLALDHLGSGYAGLTTFTQIEPEFVKLDAGLVRGVDTSARKRTVALTLLRLCARDLGVAVISGGVESAAERDALAMGGCDLFQGDLFGKPDRGFVAPDWG